MKTFLTLLAVLSLPALTMAALPASVALPAGVTEATATPQQLADAVSAAVQANPEQAQSIVSQVIASIKGLNNAEALAKAVIASVAAVVPPAKLPAIVAAAAAEAPELAGAMTAAAVAVVPSQAAAIRDAVVKAVPDKTSAIQSALAAIGAFDGNQFIPVSTINTMNPANFGSSATPTPTPRRLPTPAASPTPTPTPSPTPTPTPVSPIS
jgi:hypothetical protein